MHFGKTIMGVAALILTIAILSTMVGIRGAQALTVGTGSVTCLTLGGVVKFTAKLRGSIANSRSETTRFQLTLGGCHTTGSNISVVRTGSIDQTVVTEDTSCLRVMPENAGQPISFTVNWSSLPAVAPSVVTFSNDQPADTWRQVAGHHNVVRRAIFFPRTTGTPGVAAVTEGTSFPGGDGGASSTLFLKSNKTPKNVRTDCGTTGLSSFTVLSGRVVLQ